MDTPTIRRTFLDFFAERGHTIVPSSSLVPDDPTLLLTNAGMVQFKPFFLGEKEAPFSQPRAATLQKVFRTTDIEEVGKDARHLSFWEMLGNFSFGDYFKLDAIRWAWELVTERFGLEPDRLWVTVFTTDDEAARIWEEEAGLPEDRILRRGREDGNFWDMGVAGPCGPCSEMLYDRGPEFGAQYEEGKPLDDERYLEFYNLVFMQNIQDDDFQIVGDLPNKNIDTGLGMERFAAVLQNVPSAFEVDTLAPILAEAEKAIGRRFGDDPKIDVSLRVLAEHARAMTMLISDGVLPSNEERGYVVRRLIRRAVRYARLAGVDEPVLVPLTRMAVEIFGGVYPEVGRNRDLVKRVVEKEEERFDQTLRQGLGTLEEEIARIRESGGTTLPGSVAFKLHDTYGFPLDLTKEIAGEEGLRIELQEFDSLMKAQRARARAARSPGAEDVPDRAVLEGILAASSKTEFLGYERLDTEAMIVGIVRGGDSVPVLDEGMEGEVVLDRTPFYPEGGGQIGDRGEIRIAGGSFRVEDTERPLPGLIVHKGKVVSGEIRTGDEAIASVDALHREGVRQSHTATHMVHWALQHFLGEHARQQGSLVEVGRLRFDFSHFERVDDEELLKLEEEVNRRVLFDDSVRALETTYDYAMSIGAMALFGEKYGDFVRVVEVGDYSKELCGGTHVAHTGQIGVVKFSSESSVGAGLRRVEAYTGLDGLRYLNRQAERLKRMASMLNVDQDRIESRLERMIADQRELEARLAQQRAAGQRDEVRKILASEAVRQAGGARLVVVRRDETEVGDIRRLAQALRDEIGTGVVVIASARDGAANIVVASSRDLVGRGISAQQLLVDGAVVLGGKAGGKAGIATTGGPNASEIDRATAAVEAAVVAALDRLS